MYALENIEREEEKQKMELYSNYGLEYLSQKKTFTVVKQFVQSGCKAYTKATALANLTSLVILLNMGFNSVEEIDNELIGQKFQYFWPLGITASLAAINDVCGLLYDVCRLIAKCGKQDSKFSEFLDVDKVTEGELIKSIFSRFASFGVHTSSAIPSLYSPIASLVNGKPTDLGHGNAECFLVTAGFALFGLALNATPFDKWIDKGIGKCRKTQLIGKDDKSKRDKKVDELFELCNKYQEVGKDKNVDPKMLKYLKGNLIDKMKNVIDEMPDNSLAGWLANVFTKYGVPIAATVGLVGGLIKLIQAVNADGDEKLANDYLLTASKFFTGATIFYTLELGDGLTNDVKGLLNNIGSFFKSSKELAKRTCYSSNCCRINDGYEPIIPISYEPVNDEKNIVINNQNKANN